MALSLRKHQSTSVYPSLLHQLRLHVKSIFSFSHKTSPSPKVSMKFPVYVAQHMYVGETRRLIQARLKKDQLEHILLHMCRTFAWRRPQNSFR